MNPFCLDLGFSVLNVMHSLKLSNLTYITAQRLYPIQQPTETSWPNQTMQKNN